jgi:hypothetical protein
MGYRRLALRLTALAIIGGVAFAPQEAEAASRDGCMVCIGFPFQCPTQSEMFNICYNNCLASPFQEGTCLTSTDDCPTPGEYAVVCSLS